MKLQTILSFVTGPKPEQKCTSRGEVAEYEDKTVLISGAGGSIGAELCQQVLVQNPRKLVLLENSEHALFCIEGLLSEMADGVELCPMLGSVCDDGFLQRVFSEHKVDIVLHAAAYKHVAMVEKNPTAGIVNNVFGTRCLALAAQCADVHRFVLISTDKAVRPVGVMGATKRLAELLIRDLALRSSGTVFSIVRFGNVLGSSGSVVPIFRDQIARGGPVTLRDRRMTRYFMTVQEASRLVLSAGAIAQGGEIFVLDMGQPVRIAELAVKMIEAAGTCVRALGSADVGIEIQETGLLPGEKLHEELVRPDGEIYPCGEKIFRVEEDGCSEIEIAALLRNLRKFIDAGDETRAVAELKNKVAEGETASQDITDQRQNLQSS
ncbi:polysaccharide biosynthesis protein [Halocynthiibacter sp.]|uniref:polysaccharide biosynthesis protein n=1 Tax=Halocynthiibacter sp. TaxID=1979210 RepID=UPI003C533C4F